MTAPRLFFVAAEPSGDLLASEVIEVIKAREPGVSIAGIGGEEMAAHGIRSAIDTRPLAVLGFWEGVKAWRTAVKLAEAAVDEIILAAPQTVILVDSWGFMLRLAQRLRRRAPHIRLIKLVGPQVWASRPGRAKTLAATVDHLLCVHDIEEPFYSPYGLATTVIGNPALSRTQKGDGAGFRALMGIGEDEQMLLVLPGSRASEITRVAPALIEAAKQLKENFPSLQVVISPARSIAAQFEASFPGVSDWARLSAGRETRYDAMAAADLALACSGTVTSELAVQDTPMIVAYKTGWITWGLARGFLYKKKHITLLNIISDDREIVPEFFQNHMQPDLIAAKAAEWLSSPDMLATQRQAQADALARMQRGERKAAEIAADIILQEAMNVSK